MKIEDFRELCFEACTRFCRDFGYDNTTQNQLFFYSGAMFMVAGALEEIDWEAKLKEYKDGATS